MGTYVVYLNLNERHLKNIRAIKDTLDAKREGRRDTYEEKRADRKNRFNELNAERCSRYDAIRSTRAHLSRPRSPRVETDPMKPPKVPRKKPMLTNLDKHHQKFPFVGHHSPGLF
ncbi:hypothetical protein N7486_003343 [Penicillium sp. IBT 16267x]|nr:hypothetical protein N7486_003343 [Penicillium sp. IBT 16267x]